MKKKHKTPNAMSRAIMEERMSFRTGLAMLVENELEKAEVVLNAKGMVDKLQDITEDLAKMEASDLMPLLDALKASYGPSVADRFHQVATSKIRAAVEVMMATKDALGTEVLKLENVVNGDPVNDMAMDDGFDDVPSEDDSLDTSELPPEDTEEDEPEIDLGDDDEEVDPVFDNGSRAAAGRARKESAIPKGSKLRESAGSSRIHIASAEELGDICERMTVTADDDGYEDITPKAFYDACEWLEKQQHHRGGIVKKFPVDLDVPARFVDAIQFGIDDMNEILGSHGEDELKSYIVSLTESILDPMILKAFRRNLREGIAPSKAAKRVAERFSVDVSDVVAIVKEAKASSVAKHVRNPRKR